MQTTTKLIVKDAKKPEIVPEVGQFYKYTFDETSIWQIIMVGDQGYTLICVVPDPKSTFDQGVSYTGKLHANPYHVFGSFKDHFEFILKITLSSFQTSREQLTNNTYD